MNRIHCLIALVFALGCSSESSESRWPPNQSTDGARNPRESTAGADADASSLPGAELPGKLPPTHETAQAVLDRIATLYQDYAAAAEPEGTHSLIGTIHDNDPAAHTHALFGTVWEFFVTPGWITYPTMTIDILSLTSCHEVGHLVGGFPFKGAGKVADGSASAAEEQADYFATKDCLPRLWANERESNAAAYAELDPSELGVCTKAYSDLPSQQLCARILVTSVQAAQIFQKEYIAQHPGDADGAPTLETPDPSVVTATKTGDVNGQCRLDTLVAGAQCDVKAFGTTIPGYVPPYGKFSDASQDAARPFACQEGPGARPKCWFHPNTHEFDCTGFESPQCVVENGVAGFYTCDTSGGPAFNACNRDEVCRLGDEDYPGCVQSPMR